MIRSLALRLFEFVGKPTPHIEDDEQRELLATIVKAASAPATMTTPGWAAELCGTAVADFFMNLPESVYSRLTALGMRVPLDGQAAVRLPGKATGAITPLTFVAEGAPIPVYAYALGGPSLQPRKAAGIACVSSELFKRSLPAVESVLKTLLSESAARGLDNVLLGSGAASASQPASLLSGVTPIAAAAAGPSAMLTDLRALLGAITAAGGREPIAFLTNLQQSLALTFAVHESDATTIDLPIISSASVPVGQVVAIECAALASGIGDGLLFDLSKEATLHSDTAPLAIGTPGAPATVAAPTSSLWQSDTIAIRLIVDATWQLRASGRVAYIAAVNW